MNAPRLARAARRDIRSARRWFRAKARARLTTATAGIEFTICDIRFTRQLWNREQLVNRISQIANNEWSTISILRQAARFPFRNIRTSCSRIAAGGDREN